jgi:hypothetical protein
MFFAPSTCEAEHEAIFAIARYLKTQLDQNVSLKGFTYSHAKNTIFNGWWYNPETKDWDREGVVWFVVDYDYSQEGEDFTNAINRLYAAIATSYKDKDREQTEIFITAHSIMGHRFIRKQPK